VAGKVFPLRSVPPAAGTATDCRPARSGAEGMADRPPAGASSVDRLPGAAPQPAAARPGIYEGDLVHARVRGGPRRPRRRCRVASVSCGGSCRASSRRSGAVRRSPRIFGKLIRSGRLGPVSRGHLSSCTAGERATRAGHRPGSCAPARRLLRKHRRLSMARTPRFLAPARLIGRRPVVAEHRAYRGDWGGDLIVGRRAAQRSIPWSTDGAAVCGWCACRTDTATVL
jgi:hypothetical protein